MTQTILSRLTLAAALASAAGSAHATEFESPTPASSGARADVEIDPLAYAAGGYSVHVGLGADRVRVDLGAFAADVPEWIHQAEGFDVRMDGFGTKLDLFLERGWRGPFAGLEAGLIGTTLRAPDGTHDFYRRVQVGGRVGWRIPLAAGFYATPWVALGYTIGAGDHTVGSHRYEENPWFVFPTLHVGYQVR